LDRFRYRYKQRAIRASGKSANGLPFDVKIRTLYSPLKPDLPGALGIDFSEWCRLEVVGKDEHVEAGYCTARHPTSHYRREGAAYEVHRGKIGPRARQWAAFLVLFIFKRMPGADFRKSLRDVG